MSAGADLGLTQGARLHALIEDLLFVAAADHQRISTELGWVDLPDLFAALTEELAPVTAGRLIAHVHDDAPAPTIDGDKLRRILVNLVPNAVKYAPEGPIHLDAEAEGDHVVLAVTDEGPGIPEADRDRIFERFVQLDGSAARRAGGTGLGLHLSRQLAELLGRTLEITAGPTGGARFEFRSHPLSGGVAPVHAGDAGSTEDVATGARPHNGIHRSPATQLHTRPKPTLTRNVG